MKLNMRQRDVRAGGDGGGDGDGDGDGDAMFMLKILNI